MDNWLKKLQSWFYKPAIPTLKFIFIGVGYHSYSVAATLHKRDDYELVAFIAEEPWSHLTELLGVKLYYPSELLALSDKHNISMVLHFEAKGWIPDSATIDQLTKRKVDIISFAEDLTSEQVLEQLDKQLSAL